MRNQTKENEQKKPNQTLHCNQKTAQPKAIELTISTNSK